MAEPLASPQTPLGWLRHTGLYWFPPLLWMAVMCGLSTETFAAENTGAVLWHVVQGLAPRVTSAQYALLHFLTRKAAHLTEYAILGVFAQTPQKVYFGFRVRNPRKKANCIAYIQQNSLMVFAQKAN